MKAKLQQAIDCFAAKGSQIEGLYDLLIRGSSADSHDDLVEGWSDLDTSVIVEKITTNVLKQVKELHLEIAKVFPYKVSITVVTKNDYLSPYHHHGIKPIYYSYLLEKDRSLLARPNNYVHKLPLELLRMDCLANLSYLIHDIRNRYVQLDMEDDAALRHFFCHLSRRSGHFIRNALFVLTGIASEKIDPVQFSKFLPDIDKDFLPHLESSKYRFKEITNLESEVNIIVNELEKIHEALIQYKNFTNGVTNEH